MLRCISMEHTETALRLTLRQFADNHFSPVSRLLHSLRTSHLVLRHCQPRLILGHGVIVRVALRHQSSEMVLPSHRVLVKDSVSIQCSVCEGSKVINASASGLLYSQSTGGVKLRFRGYHIEVFGVGHCGVSVTGQLILALTITIVDD